MQAKAKLLSMPCAWHDMKQAVGEAADEANRGYYFKHRHKAAATASEDSQPDALEVINCLNPAKAC